MKHPSTITVCIIDDDTEYHELYRRFLEGFPEWRFGLCFQSGPDFNVAEICRHRPELIFLDYVLGGQTGLSILKRIREINKDSAVIIFTGQGDERIAAEIVKAGADDYIPKTDLTPDVLRLSVSHALDRFNMRAERAKSERERAERERNTQLRADIWRLAAEKTLSQDTLIQRLLETIGPALSLTRSTYQEREEKSGDYICRHEWRKKSVPSGLGTRIPRFVQQAFPWQPYLTFNADHFPANIRAPFIKLLKRFGVRSFLSISCEKSDQPIGFFCFIENEFQREWTQAEISLLVEMVNIITLKHEQLRMEAEKEALQAQLSQARKMEAVGQLAGGVAHDFNNILSSISSYADLLTLRLTDSAQVAEYAKRIQEASRIASDLTARLLAFARKGRYHPLVFDLHELLRELLLTQCEQASPYSILTLAGHFEAARTAVLGDREQLQTAFFHICQNAREAMPNGGQLTLSTCNISLDAEFSRSRAYRVVSGDYLLITFQDTGPGIPLSMQEHIFEPFFTTKGPRQGAGLGLSSVYGVVKNHGGYIEVNSEPNQGTAFLIYLPTKPAQEQNASSDPLAASRISDMGAKHILFVDDEQMLRNIGQDMLREMGHSVTLCKSGKEALDYYRNPERCSVDMVVLDIIMPDMDGLSVFRELKAINPAIKVVAATGHAPDKIVGDMLALGIKGLILKPFRFAEFSNKIRQALSEA